MIVDAHLDLAYNVTRGRDPRQPAAVQPFVENEYATVGLPDLRAGDVRLICATVFCTPASYDETGYRTADEARAQALEQLRTYQQWIAEGLLRFVTRDSFANPAVAASAGQRDLHSRAELRSADSKPAPAGLAALLADAADRTNAILLLEGADALRSVDDIDEWFAAGLRIVGLSWKRTRAAGGTGDPGPLTDEGKQLVRAFDDRGIIIDTSHLAEESFWNLLDTTQRPVMASHSNCRAIVPTDRQLSDEMIRAIVERGGVIGINFFDKFLVPPDEVRRRATLGDVVRHIRYICDIAGNANHVGIGTDMDGGLGREQIPQEIRTSADLQKLGPALSAAGFADTDVENVLSGNWLRFFQQCLQ